jgi:hypothetical protein
VLVVVDGTIVHAGPARSLDVASLPVKAARFLTESGNGSHPGAEQ